MKSKLFLLFFLIPFSAVNAQMFSVGGDSQDERLASSTYFRVGYAPVDFSFQGGQSLTPQQTLSFEQNAINFGIESPVLSGSLSLVNRLTGSDELSYFNLSIDYNNRFGFVRTSKFQFGLPVNIFTSLVNVQSVSRDNNFSQSTLGVGSGFFTSIRPLRKLSFFIEGTPFIGFSSSDGGLFGGSNRGINASARINFLNIFPGRSLSLGYDYKFSSYDINGDEFDYDLTHHLITLGVSL